VLLGPIDSINNLSSSLHGLDFFVQSLLECFILGCMWIVMHTNVYATSKPTDLETDKVKCSGFLDTASLAVAPQVTDNGPNRIVDNFRKFDFSTELVLMIIIDHESETWTTRLVFVGNIETECEVLTNAFNVVGFLFAIINIRIGANRLFRLVVVVLCEWILSGVNGNLDARHSFEDPHSVIAEGMLQQEVRKGIKVRSAKGYCKLSSMKLYQFVAAAHFEE